MEKPYRPPAPVSGAAHAPSAVSDRDLVILAATEVMGATWQVGAETVRYQIPGSRMDLFAHDLDSGYIEKMEGWNPLTSIADAFMLVDALEVKGWLFSMGRDSRGDQAEDWVAAFHTLGDARRSIVVSEPDRCRAIVLACLKAEGASSGPGPNDDPEWEEAHEAERALSKLLGVQYDEFDVIPELAPEGASSAPGPGEQAGTGSKEEPWPYGRDL